MSSQTYAPSLQPSRVPSPQPAHQASREPFPCEANVVGPIPGPQSARLRAREDQLLAPGLQGYASLGGVAMDSGHGSTLTDVDGNTFVDFIGGIGVGALGHGHPKVVEAVRDQATRLVVGSFTTRPRVSLLERLQSFTAPLGSFVSQLYSSGSETVESALRLAKSSTKKFEVVSCWGGFHGKTMGTLSLMGSSGRRGLGPLMPGHIGIPYADCYRCPLGLTYPQCGLGCIEVGRTIVKHQSVGAIAAVVVEPMLGTAGNVIPPDGFLPALKELAKEWDALFIADEMITGLGRTGRVWGTMHSGVVPDIFTVGKGLGGGLPLSALLARRDIAQATPWAQPSGSSSSYGGNPLAAAAGDAALKAIAEEHLIENSARQGEFARNILLRWLDQFPFVGDVRGRGLFLGMDLVRDRTTKEPLSAASTARIFQACVQRGLLAMTYTSRVRLQPALTIDQDTLSHGLGLLEEVFEETLREGFWRDP